MGAAALEALDQKWKIDGTTVAWRGMDLEIRGNSRGQTCLLNRLDRQCSEIRRRHGTLLGALKNLGIFKKLHLAAFAGLLGRIAMPGSTAGVQLLIGKLAEAVQRIEQQQNRCQREQKWLRGLQIIG
jgi:hypothetical protein